MTDTILITGASRGIGLATAERLAADGMRVIGIARGPSERPFPGDLHEADLGDTETAATILSRIVADVPIDGIVNNLGFNIVERLGEVDLAHFDKVLNLNLRATLQATQAVLPGMRARRYGRIVNLSSRGALGRVGRSSYGAAKAGIVGMTRTWALELAGEGITANVVSPGPTATEMFRRNNLSGPDAEERRRAFLADVPLGRFGEPDEIAHAVAFFLDRRAGFVTGQLLHVCGGSSVGLAAL
ncbi:SDR family oxidoreductase [Pikeienuella sp. HZG-20]|uniref:SDR family oxidoreductase n=1 Tax=Paludibacillus litoralis TaxID=3133267 RepID=UPI0030ED2AFA